jgi:peptidoglycan/xylan/chitin deacetylase (PgdA/CDA1 family)
MLRQAARRAMKITAASADIVRRPLDGFVVLIYHRVGARTPVEVDLPRALFEEQIAYLAADCDVVTLAEGVSRVTRGSSAPMVAVTFDDGTADFADEALPVLERYGVPATLYVATEFIELGRPFPDDGAPLSWSALRDAYGTGLVDVGSHTHSHALLDRLPTDRINDELERSVDLIGERVGARAEHFAYPKAVAGSEAADGAVRERFASAALAGCRANRPGVDAWQLARSPVQKSDGMRWFLRKVRGGMGFEDTLRSTVNRRRYADATT